MNSISLPALLKQRSLQIPNGAHRHQERYDHDSGIPLVGDLHHNGGHVFVQENAALEDLCQNIDNFFADAFDIGVLRTPAITYIPTIQEIETISGQFIAQYFKA